MLSKIQNVKINYISRLIALPILAITVLAFTLRTKIIDVPFVKLDKPFTVIIDAGHGVTENGKHSGVAIEGVSEDDIVLAIANKIQQLNSNDKVKIILTRTTDKLIDLHKRVDFAKESNADLFISLHVDANTNDQDPGLNSEKSLRSGFGIYVSNKQAAYQTQSETLGSILQQELNTAYPTNPYLLKRKVGIFVLDQNVCPSVLVECGFLTDNKDRAFISKGTNQEVVAQKILAAITRYAANQQTTQNLIRITATQSNELTGKEEKYSVQKQTEKLDLKIDTQNPPLYILDGKEINKTQLDKIGPSTIESIDVLKDKSATDKYGAKGMNGVIEIKLKSHNPPLYILDGKEINEAEMKDISPNAIKSINVLKGEAATNKYGEKGANGAVEINLKANYTPSEKKVNDTIPKTDPLFTKVEVEAAVDKNEWKDFLQKNLQPFIVDAASKGAKPGTYVVKVKFIVSKDGSLSGFTALNDPGYGLATKVVEMMKDSPKWNPALQNGKPVNSYHTQPVTFVISD